MQGWKMQDWKMWDHMAGLENAGLANEGPNGRKSKCCRLKYYCSANERAATQIQYMVILTDMDMAQTCAIELIKSISKFQS